MIFIRSVLAALVVTIVPPVPVALRFHVHSEDPRDVTRVVAALGRGFYADSDVIAPAETLKAQVGSFLIDSAARRRRGTTIIVDGSIAERGELLEIRLGLLNILAQPMTAPETLRVRRESMDSVLETIGHKYASSIARRNARRRMSRQR